MENIISYFHSHLILETAFPAPLSSFKHNLNEVEEYPYFTLRNPELQEGEDWILSMNAPLFGARAPTYFLAYSSLCEFIGE